MKEAPRLIRFNGRRFPRDVRTCDLSRTSPTSGVQPTWTEVSTIFASVLTSYSLRRSVPRIGISVHSHIERKEGGSIMRIRH